MTTYVIGNDVRDPKALTFIASQGRPDAPRFAVNAGPRILPAQIRSSTIPFLGVGSRVAMAVLRKSDPMSLIPPDGRPETASSEPDEATTDPLGLDAMRSWLVSGVQFVDPRRRFGSHGRARELLVADPQVDPAASRRWQGLAAALHRHTVRGGLSELRPDERQVITLAYLEGRTNREIAALLGVSITTVQRRLLFALGRLEAYIGRTGVWLSALLLVAAAYAMRPVAHVGRLANVAAASPDRAQRHASTLTAGAMSAAVLGVVAFTSDSSMLSRAPHSDTAPSVAQTNAALPPIVSIASQLSPPESAQLAIVIEATIPATDTKTIDSPATARHHGKGCGHHTVPVGPRGGATGPPGGCRATG